MHEAYLQVSAGVAGRFPSRHFTAALLPRTARSFPGFVQFATALLPPSCHPTPALHRSLSTSVWERDLCDGEREREAEWMREEMGWMLLSVLCLLDVLTRGWSSSLLEFELSKIVCFSSLLKRRIQYTHRGTVRRKEKLLCMWVLGLQTAKER